MKITPGKQKGLKAVSDERGVIAAAAMDQRGSLKSAIAKEKGVDKKAVTAQMLEEFKTIVTRVLTPHASAILLDPEYGLPAAKARSSNAGLLLAYENSGYDNTRPGRLPDLLDIWSVRRLVRKRARTASRSCCTTRRSIRPINDIKHAWVERIGGECTAADVPFFLEFVGYEENGDEKGIEYAKQKPEIVAQEHGRIFQAAIWRGCAESGSAGEHGVRGGHRKPCKGESAYTRDQAKEHFRRAAAVGEKAVHLSFGGREQRRVFRRRWSWPPSPAWNFPGVLCGRATWKEGIPVYAQAGREGAGRLAERSGREEHQERELAPDGREAVVQFLWRDVGCGAGRLEATPWTCGDERGKRQG